MKKETLVEDTGVVFVLFAVLLLPFQAVLLHRTSCDDEMLCELHCPMWISGYQKYGQCV